jgi:drug/metabolite transporter (DMT)-like permease
MNQKLTPSTVALLTIPPLLWAGNAIVGRLVHDLVPPITLNFLRWFFALLILLPMAHVIYRRGSGLWLHWRRFAVLGLLGVGMYNALQYLALQTSTPINVTLVSASMPVWMLLIGRLFFGARISRRQLLGAALSIVGVLLVLTRGEWARMLALTLVPGDLFMLLATVVWSFYSWLLVRASDLGEIRQHWAHFLLAQVTFGAAWSALFAAGEWSFTNAHITWGWPLVAALLFVSVGPAVLAFRCWGAGVQRVGPNLASFFNNLTPLFAALMSAAFLGELPHPYHALAFLLIIAGIFVSAPRKS